jgi:hypothetical protein
MLILFNFLSGKKNLFLERKKVFLGFIESFSPDEWRKERYQESNEAQQDVQDQEDTVNRQKGKWNGWGDLMAKERFSIDTVEKIPPNFDIPEDIQLYMLELKENATKYGSDGTSVFTTGVFYKRSKDGSRYKIHVPFQTTIMSEGWSGWTVEKISAGQEAVDAEIQSQEVQGGDNMADDAAVEDTYADAGDDTVIDAETLPTEAPGEVVPPAEAAPATEAPPENMETVIEKVNEFINQIIDFPQLEWTNAQDQSDYRLIRFVANEKLIEIRVDNDGRSAAFVDYHGISTNGDHEESANWMNWLALEGFLNNQIGTVDSVNPQEKAKEQVEEFLTSKAINPIKWETQNQKTTYVEYTINGKSIRIYVDQNGATYANINTQGVLRDGSLRDDGIVDYLSWNQLQGFLESNI